MADSEQPLLQAARDLPQAEPGPALDAAILGAAAQRAEEVRRARIIATEVLAANPSAVQTRPLLARFSCWLFGDGERHGHFRQALAASIVAGIALGIVWQAERENVPAVSDVAMMEPAPSTAAPALEPAPATITQAEAVEEMPARKAMPPAREKPAAVSAMMDSTAVETKVDKVQLAAASPPLPPPPAEARGQDRAAELPPAAAPMPAPAAPSAPPMEEVAEYRADRSRAAPMAARQAAPAPVQEAAKAQEMDAEGEIDAQLKRILELRRAGKEEEVQALLRQLRARYPDGNIDERLRQREKKENYSPGH
ncbi:MAG: hypothetical protein LBE81_10795 [Azonexus sp.]|jgi:hypothetical protein|nr:hypothetical protein [Azonexus sp.]